MQAGPENAGLSASQDQDREKLCEVTVEFVRPLARRWTTKMDRLQDKITTLELEIRRLKKLAARMPPAPDQQISLSSIRSIQRFILARVKFRSGETCDDGADGSAKRIPRTLRADPLAETSALFSTAPERREDAAILMCKADHAASDPAALAPDSNPRQFDRGVNAGA